MDEVVECYINHGFREKLAITYGNAVLQLILSVCNFTLATVKAGPVF